MRQLEPALAAGIFALAALHSHAIIAATALPCASLAGLTLPDTTLTLAQEVTTGTLTVAVPPAFVPRTINGLPPFCRVAGVIKPTSDSNIQFEVWLPLVNWNGRFAGVGNGTTAGSIIYAPIGTLTDSLAVQLNRGYAVANSDMGHPADVDPSRFGFDHPEQLVDFGTRATHELTLKGKALTRAFYGMDPTHSYWYGCSTGGRQGLMEAQRFPDDYDGIVAGSPANNYTAALATMLDNTIRIQKDPVANLSQDKADLLAHAVAPRAIPENGSLTV
jgi:feruloyl esterase